MQQLIFSVTQKVSKLMGVYGIDSMRSIAITNALKKVLNLKNNKLTDKMPEYIILIRNRDLYADFIMSEFPSIDLSSSNAADFCDIVNKLIKELSGSGSDFVNYFLLKTATACFINICKNKGVDIPEKTADTNLLIEATYHADMLS